MIHQFHFQTSQITSKYKLKDKSTLKSLISRIILRYPDDKTTKISNFEQFLSYFPAYSHQPTKLKKLPAGRRDAGQNEEPNNTKNHFKSSHCWNLNTEAMEK